MTSVTSVNRGRRVSFPPAAVFAFALIPFGIEALGVFVPAAQGVYLSFEKWNGIGAPQFIGFDNYVRLAGDPIFQTALKNTVVWVALFGGISFVGGLGIALLLQSERRGVAIYRTALFLPVVFSLVVTSLIWTTLYLPDGVINQSLIKIGLSSFTKLWLGDPHTALFAVIVAALWRQIGYIMVLFIAGLKAIDPALSEAAVVDGCSRWQKFRYITFPQLRSVNLVIISVLVIDSLRSFDVVYSMTRGGPFNSSELLSTYMYTTAVQARSLGYGSAIAVVILLLTLGFIVSYLVRAFSDAKE